MLYWRMASFMLPPPRIFCFLHFAATPPQKNDEKEKEERVKRREEKGLIYSCIGAYYLSHHVGIATSYRALSWYGAF